MAETFADTRKVLRNHRSGLLERKNVVATGLGYKVSGGRKTSSLSIVCSVVKKVAASQVSTRDRVPAYVDGVPTDVIETGMFRPLQSPTDRIRPEMLDPTE